MTKYFMYMYGGHMCICIPNIKFPCPTLWQGEVCPDDDNDNDANTDAKGGLSRIILGFLVDKPNEPKNNIRVSFVTSVFKYFSC